MLSSNKIFALIEANKILSKSEFLKTYGQVEKNEVQEFYLLLLQKLENSIQDSDVKKLEAIGTYLEYVHHTESTEILGECFKNDLNPFLKCNIIIKACKHEGVAILKSVVKSKKLKVLSTWTRGKTLDFNDEDDESHNAFYYAIRSSNVDLLEGLIKVWENLKIDVKDLENIIASSFRELKLRKVPLSIEMESNVMHILFNLQPTTNAAKPLNKEGEGIFSRVDFVAENIELLITEYNNHDKDVDEKFLHAGKIIAINIHVLKHLLNFSYDELPWEEIEFCLYAFIVSFTKASEISIFFQAILNKEKILLHLRNFSKKMKDVCKSLDETKLRKRPRISRDEVINKIVAVNPEFKELYDDYQNIRDVHTLNKIKESIDHVSSTDSKTREGQLMLIRSIQIVGEHLKNTLESPKLSVTTSELLLLSLPKATRKMLIELRDSISHSFSLYKRIEIEQNSNDTFFEGLKADMTQIGNVIHDILLSKKKTIIKMLLTKIIHSSNIDDSKNALTALDCIQFDQILKISANNQDKSLKVVTEKFSDIISDKTHFEKLMFEKLRTLLANHTVINNDYLKAILLLKSENQNIGVFTPDNNIFRGLKFRAKECLTILSSEAEQRNHPQIIDLLSKIFFSAYARTQNDELMKLMLELWLNGEFSTANLKWIEELKGELNKKINKIVNQKSSHFKDKNLTKYLELKVSELKNILVKLNISKSSIRNISSCMANRQQLITIEMLVLDILTIIEDLRSLPSDMFLLDHEVPIMCGRWLRNHLAHGNYVSELLITEPNVSLILSAILFTTDTVDPEIYVDFCQKRINSLKYHFSKDLNIILNQQKLRIVLENSDLNAIRSKVSEGADLIGIDFSSSSALHIASKTSCLEVIRYLIDNSKVSIEYKDKTGVLPLHTAAMHGRKEIVEFYIQGKKIPVDAQDNTLKTSLHHAAINGHAQTVSSLLYLKANIVAKDLSFNTPLFYALRNKHLAVVEILLKEHVHDDIDNSAGPFTCLYIAAESGSIDLVNVLLKKNHNVNDQTDRGFIPLHVASLNGHLEVVNLLISHGSEISTRGFDGCTPLHYAVENGHVDIARTLVSNGADVNAFDKAYYNTPLHYAAKDGYEEIVDILLMNKANPTAVTTEGMTPLHFAASEGHTGIVTSLLKSGCDVNAKNIIHCTPLHLAAENGHIEVIDLLISKNAYINFLDLNGLTPLHRAVVNNHPDVVQYLLGYGAETDVFSQSKKTPLHLASEENFTAVIEHLITNKASINIEDNKGRTPLHLAALNGHTNAVAVLLKNEANINAKDDDDMTPLHAAAVTGHESVVDILLQSNADVSVLTSTLCTPLHYAALGNNIKCIKMLLSKGVNIYAKDKFSKTPLSYAVKNNNVDMVNALVSYGLKIDDEYFNALVMAVTLGYKSIVEILLKSCVVNKKLGDHSLLHLAAKGGHSGIVACLLSHDADVDAKTSEGASPLYVAAVEGHEKVAEILLDHKADINAKCFDGTTPLFIASLKGHLKVVKLLIKHGANANIKDLKNRTSVEIAVAYKHLDVVKYFIESGFDINNTGSDFSLLHIAADWNCLEIARYLVTKGCNINVKNASGSKPIHIAAREGCVDILQLFFDSGCNINDLGMNNQTLLHYAAMKGQFEVVKILLDKGANVNAKDDKGLVPLHTAALFSFKNVVEILLSYGAYYNIEDNLGKRPSDAASTQVVRKVFVIIKRLFDAIKDNNSVEVENCIKEGAIIDCKNNKNSAPLHIAAWKGYSEIIQLLLKNRCNPNIVGKQGCTSLHYACKFSHLAIVEALLCNGAKYNIPCESGKIPVDVAEDRDVIHLLTLVHNAFDLALKNSPKLVRMLEKVKSKKTIKAIFNARNEDNKSLVEIAICKNFSEFQQLENILRGEEPSLIPEATDLAAKGDYQNAVILLNRELDNRRKMLGADNPFCLDVQDKISVFLYKQGNYRDALKIQEEIFQKRSNWFGNDHVLVLKTRSSIALTLHRMGENKQALEIFEEIYSKQKQVHGSDHDDILETQLHMALVLDKLKRFDEALFYNKLVYEERKKAKSLLAIPALNNVAMVLANQQKFEEALEVYKDVLVQKQIFFGIDHPETLRTSHNIATVLLRQQKYTDALDILKSVLQCQKKTSGPVHPDTLNTQANIANIYFEQGKWIAAYKSLKEVVEIRKSVFGTLDIVTQNLSVKLAAVKERFQSEHTSESELQNMICPDIIVASNNGDVKSVQKLLEKGSDANERDAEGRTPLHFSANNNDIELAQLLLQKGADPSLVTNKGNTPLHTAVSKGHEDMVQVILNHSDPTTKNKFIDAVTFSGRNSALHVAAKNGDLPIVLLLLQHGANFEMKNSEGKMPSDLSSDEIIFNFLELIKNLFVYAEDGSPKLIKKVKSLENIALLAVSRVRNSLDHTLMHVLIKKSHKNIAFQLINIFRTVES